MIVRLIILLALLASVLVQYGIPDVPLYQYGWYSVLIAALFGIALLQSRTRKESTGQNAVSILLIRFGMGLIALAGIANGLFAPSAATAIASPGTALPVSPLNGTVNFPLVRSDTNLQPTLMQGNTDIPLCGGRARIIGSFEVWCTPRDVVAVQAFDPKNARLTITQPTGSAFLSPVLLLVGRQTIENMSLPYDTFALPAAHRIVTVVFFDARHAAILRNARVDQPAILFAVDDETGRPLSHAIRMVQTGTPVAVGGVQLIGTALKYPALRIVPVPKPLVVLGGIVAIALGMLLHIRSQFDRRLQHEL